MAAIVSRHRSKKLSHSVAPIANPSELIVSSVARSTVVKRLVIRNRLKHNIVMKLLLSEGSGNYIKLESTKLKIEAGGIARILITIQTKKVGILSRIGNELKGYIRLGDTFKDSELKDWLDNDKTERRHQLAFTLNIRFANEFSAVETVLDLPGTARLEEPRLGVHGVDDLDTKTALNIDADCYTARDCESIMEYIKEIKTRQRSKPKETNWGLYDMANSMAETVKTWCEPEKKRQFSKFTKKARSEVSKRSGRVGPKARTKSTLTETNDGKMKAWTVETESEYINQEMNATPCGGN